MNTLGIDSTDRDPVIGWESTQPKKISAQETAYRQLSNIAEEAWQHYIVVCDLLEDAKYRGDKVAVDFYLEKVNQALDAAKDSDVIKSRAYQSINGGVK